MKKKLNLILLILFLSSICKAQEFDSLSYGVDSLYNLQLELKSKQGTLTDCDFAIENAKRDFNANLFTLHSNAFSGNCSYCAVLRQDYNINWRFTNDLFSDYYYNCYDSIMSLKLKEKYNNDLFNIARIKADSLSKTDNWIREAEYIGGQDEMMNFITSRLSIDSTRNSILKSKIYVQIEIDNTGKVKNPVILRGINKDYDRKVLDILYQMPDWKPALLYGKPIRQQWNIPIKIYSQEITTR